MAERVGFEPTDAFASPVFKTGSFNRSDISPEKAGASIVQALVYDTMTTYNLSTNFRKAFFGKFCFFSKKDLHFLAGRGSMYKLTTNSK